MNIPCPFGIGIAKPGCPGRCGNVSIPYPFGIGSHCYLNPSFEVVCNSTFHPPKPYLNLVNLEVEDLALGRTYNEPQTITVKTAVEKTCGDQNENINSIDLSGTPYRFSVYRNVFLGWGCRSNVILRNRSNVIQGGCSSLCDDSSRVVTASCDDGIGCCRINMGVGDDKYTHSLDVYNYTDSLDVYSLNVVNVPTSSHNCTCTMLVSKTYMSKLLHDHSSSANFQFSSVPTVLYWIIFGNSRSIMPSSDDKSRTCYSAGKEKDGVTCNCYDGYKGNPYIPYGCQGWCVFSSESGAWSCSPDYHPLTVINAAPVPIALILSFTVALLLACSSNIYVCIRKRHLTKLKVKFFEQNGGLLLKQQLALYGGAESTRIFKAVELKTATKNYRNTNILGKGGFGTVYKGVLPNQQVVAIKKSP